MPDRIVRAFNRSGATQAVALDISKAFNRVWHSGLLHKHRSYGISCQIIGLISFILSNRWLQVVLDGKSSQECQVSAAVPQEFIFGPTLFLLNISDLPVVICNIAIYADDATLYSKCDQAFDLCNNENWLLNLNLNYETLNWGRKWPVDFNTGKTELVLFDQSNNTGVIYVKMMGLFLWKNHLLRC